MNRVTDRVLFVSYLQYIAITTFLGSVDYLHEAKYLDLYSESRGPLLQILEFHSPLAIQKHLSRFGPYVTDEIFISSDFIRTSKSSRS